MGEAICWGVYRPLRASLGYGPVLPQIHDGKILSGFIALIGLIASRDTCTGIISSRFAIIARRSVRTVVSGGGATRQLVDSSS